MKKLLYIILCVSICFGAASCTPEKPTQTTTKVEKTTVATTETMAPKEPSSLGEMNMDKLYYKPKQATTIYYCDATAFDNDQLVFLRSLQGLVAREVSASIYIAQNENDVFWKRYLADSYGIVFKDATFEQLLGLYLNNIESIIVYNAKREYQLPLAQTMASLHNGVVVSNSLYKNLLSFFELKLADSSITEYRMGKKWTSATQAIRWAKQHLLVDSSTHYLGLTSNANDYLYATKALCLYVNPESKAQMKALKKLVATGHYCAPAIYISNSDNYTDALSKYGFGHQNLQSINNLTFFASFKKHTDLKEQPQAVDKGAEDGKIYIAFNVTCNSICPNATQLNNLLNNTARGSVEVSVSLSPALYELAPPVLNWCYANRGVSTVFISTDMGVSSINPETYPDTNTNDWFYVNDYMLRGSRLNLVSIEREFSESFALTLSENQSATGYICNRISESFVVNNTPFIKSKNIFIYENRELESYYIAPSSDGKAKFLCFNLAVDEFDEQVFEKINETIYTYQQANPGKVEFLQIHDLAKTMLVYNLENTTTATTTTTKIKGEKDVA